MASSSRSNSAPFRPSPSLLEDTSLNTLKDPRTASTSDLSTISPHHPDLSNEVAALSDKLIQAINNQSRLDDNLSETRHELEDARARIHQLEGDVRKHEEDLSSGRLVWKADVEADLSRMRETLEAEKTKRAQAEKEKKGMEQELENLTAALFEEANKVLIFCK
jgi:DNA repair ATPase RecN